jgi:hypothetical protein
MSAGNHASLSMRCHFFVRLFLCWLLSCPWSSLRWPVLCEAVYCGHADVCLALLDAKANVGLTTYVRGW